MISQTLFVCFTTKTNIHNCIPTWYHSQLGKLHHKPKQSVSPQISNSRFHWTDSEDEIPLVTSQPFWCSNGGGGTTYDGYSVLNFPSSLPLTLFVGVPIAFNPPCLLLFIDISRMWCSLAGVGYCRCLERVWDWSVYRCLVNESISFYFSWLLGMSGGSHGSFAER